MKKAYHHGDLRRALITESVDRVRQSGEKAIVVREVATAVGVSATAAYRHFDNRQDLVAAVAEKGFAVMRERMTTPAVTDGGATPVGDRFGLAAYAELRNRILGLLDHACEERPWARLMLDEWRRLNDSGDSADSEVGELIAEPLHEPVRRGAAVGFFRSDLDDGDERRLWLGVLSLVTSVVFEIFPGDTLREMLGEDGRKLADSIVDHLLTDRGRELIAEVGGGPETRTCDLDEWVPAEVGASVVR